MPVVVAQNFVVEDAEGGFEGDCSCDVEGLLGRHELGASLDRVDRMYSEERRERRERRRLRVRGQTYQSKLFLGQTR